MQGTVTRFSKTKNGKPTIYIDDKMYFVGRCDVSGLSVGDRIDFEGHAFSDDGKLWGLDKWGKLPKENGEMRVPGGMQQTVVNSPVTMHPYTTGGSLDEPTLRFISNCVGSAITAGTIKDPMEIEKWVSAARNAIRGQS